MTERQLALLELLHLRISATGVCPSIRELAAELRVGVGRIMEMLQRLEEGGHIRRLRQRARAIEVVRPPVYLLDADEVTWCHRHAVQVRAMRAALEAPR